jgi:transcriptional regulator with XRE-family HTH domain
MMHLKEKLLQVLEMKNYTYADLAAHLSISEAELDEAIENNTIEIRTLELISKELRIPLYSFFRENFEGFDFEKEPYYNVSIWDKEEEPKSLPDVRAMRMEIEALRADLRKKEKMIQDLESKITKR